MVFDVHLDSFFFLLFFFGGGCPLVLSVVGVYQIFYKYKKRLRRFQTLV